MDVSQKIPNLARIFAICIMLVLSVSLQAQTTNYTDSWAEEGISILSSGSSKIELNYSLKSWQLSDIDIEGSKMHSVQLPGVFLPNNAGAPDLPGTSRYFAIPKGATANVRIVSSRVETLENVEIAPAPVIPAVPEDGEMKYSKDMSIYSTNSFYPEKFVQVSDIKNIRGVDVAMVGITPFQYNPVTKELKIYRDMVIEINFDGGTGYGDAKYRNRYFEPILQSMIANYSDLPKVNFNNRSFTKGQDYEYLIICPDNVSFLAWADSIKNFRTEQGIYTGIVTTTEIGGNSTSAIENYINNAYNNWDNPPAAVLLIGDYGSSATTITSPTLPHPYSGTYISDNVYADVDGDELPDIAFARMTAQNAVELETMVTKFLNYERNPPVNPTFYNKPIAAGGWQTERWFILADEVVYGFWENVLGKNPVREYAIYDGTPGSVWSTNQNTSMVVNYFGPNGLGYIPSTPAHLNDWGGNPTRINNDINEGSFMLLHRDHGGENGWGEPDYGNDDIPGLDNDDLTFVFSINCLTGKFNWSSESFAEKFHKYGKGALGLIAATEVSYSFVNDTYIWGLYDYMWPEFDPGNGESGDENLLPAFANVSGKYYLEASSWPYNVDDKVVTYNLFHMHGDAFSRIYSEMPQNLTVVHDPVHTTGVPAFTVQANEGALIAISHNGELLATADATGGSVDVEIPFVTAGEYLTLTVTKQNYYRYSTQVQVIPAEGPYVVKNTISVDDAASINPNNMVDYGESVILDMSVKNVGLDQANNVVVKLRSTDEFVTISDSVETYGNIAAEDTMFVDNGFAVTIADNVPDKHQLSFQVVATDGTSEWLSNFSLEAHAPVLQYISYEISDPTGNNNGKLDAGETANVKVSVKNKGTSPAYTVSGNLVSDYSGVTVTNATQNYGTVAVDASVEKSFTVTVGQDVPQGKMVNFDIAFSGGQGITGEGSFYAVVGQFPVLIVDLDENHNSGPKMLEAFEANNLPAEYSTSFPSDFTLYTSMFVCLGIYSNNTVLSSGQGQALADFLNSGGKLYMEGGDTWYYDSQTPVHGMFNISASSDGSSNLATINGQTGEFTEGMSFSYGGDNSYVDQINATGTGFLLFKNSSPSYGCMVGNEGSNYKTIGASLEFGGLTDGNSPSTKADLMAEIIDFFELNGGGSNDTLLYREVEVAQGWNIISAPVHADDMSIAGCFPNASSNAYAFTNSYVTVENIACGEGYWLKFDSPETISMSGSAMNEPVAVNEGWNLIGVFGDMVNTSGITTSPENIITTAFYGYGTGYSVATELEPGKGYWVKTSAAGNINYTSKKRVAKTSAFEIPEEWGAISFSDADGNLSTLYTIKGDTKLNAELPPMPPAGVFDIRYSTNTFAEKLSTASVMVNLSGVKFPLKIKAVDTDITVTNPLTGSQSFLHKGEEFVISEAATQNIEISEAEIPDTYSLSQNYPNPFNPKTTIRVAIPQNSKVSLKIYDVTGSEVTTLVNQNLEAGYYNFEWNASQFASGVYLYRVIAGDFVQTKKLVLLK